VKEKAKDLTGVKAVENSLKAYYKEVKKASYAVLFGNNNNTRLCCCLCWHFLVCYFWQICCKPLVTVQVLTGHVPYLDYAGVILSFSPHIRDLQHCW